MCVGWAGGRAGVGGSAFQVEPFGADELREVMVGRRRRELERQRLEQARRAAQRAAMDLRLYREELQALTVPLLPPSPPSFSFSLSRSSPLPSLSRMPSHTQM